MKVLTLFLPLKCMLFMLGHPIYVPKLKTVKMTFSFKSCKLCLQCSVPMFGVGILFWIQYVYVFQLCIRVIESYTKMYLYISFATIFFTMVLWCFIAAICKQSAIVPKEYRVSASKHNILMQCSEDERNDRLQKIIRNNNLLVYTCSANGSIRYCQKCRHIKPDRAHHCSACEVCVLKMDHHCPWINNCVSYSNYKQFLLLVTYVTIYSLYFVSTSLEYVIQFFENVKDNQDFIHFLGGYVFAVVAFILFMVLLGFHIQLVAKNETTLESLRDLVFCEGNMTFNLGCQRNFTQVFGDKVFLWFLPVFSSLGDGYTFHVLNRVL